MRFPDLFWEGMKCIFFATCAVQFNDLDEERMGEVVWAIDYASAVLNKVERKRRERKCVNNKMLL